LFGDAGALIGAVTITSEQQDPLTIRRRQDIQIASQAD
jgi:hypothetical protein